MLTDSTLTTRQVAERLGVNVRRVHSLVEKGELSPTRIEELGPRGPLFFTAEDIAAYEARKAAGAAS